MLNTKLKFDILEDRTVPSVAPITIPGLFGPVPSGNASTTAAFSNTTFDATTVFSLHSDSEAHHVIYLDFNGNTYTNNIWTQIVTNGKSIVTPPYDIDGNPANFSNAERQNIYNIWRRVSEDYIPFDVDVTTEFPGLDYLQNSGNSVLDPNWGVRVNIGGSGGWLRQVVGGISIVGDFDDFNDDGVFVFSNNLYAGNEKATAEAISHEVGHSLGLSHDGTSTNAYYNGQGSGLTGWAPIMGIGYTQNLTQWSKGEYPDANNKQDDLAIITTQNGFGYRTDDYGNNITTATNLDVVNGRIRATGIIEKNTDLDYFSFDTIATETITLNAKPAPWGPNLDIKMNLYDSTGKLLSSSNPISSLSASLTVIIPEGRYYISIDGVGKGSPLAVGYSDYGSLGQYTITGTEVDVNSLDNFAIVDDGDAGFSAVGWTESTKNPSYYQGDTGYKFGRVGSNVAQWQADLVAGTYRIATTWIADASWTPNAIFSVYNGDNLLATKTMNESVSPKDVTINGSKWNYIGTVTVTSDGIITVKLSGGTDGKYILADAVRFERIS